MARRVGEQRDALLRRYRTEPDWTAAEGARAGFRVSPEPGLPGADLPAVNERAAPWRCRRMDSVRARGRVRPEPLSQGRGGYLRPRKTRLVHGADDHAGLLRFRHGWRLCARAG